MAWNKPTSNTVDATSSSRPSGRGKMPRLRKGLIAGAIVVLGAGLAAWLLTSGEATSSSLQKKDRGRIKEVTPAAVSFDTEIQTNNDPHAGMYQTKGGAWYKKGEPSLPFYTRHHNAVTNSLRRKHGSSVAKSATESVLLQIFSRTPGDMPPPLPRLPDKEMKNLVGILISKNPPTDADTESTKISKEILQQAKDAMREYLKQGGTADDFLAHYHKELLNAYQTRKDAQRLLSSFIKEGEAPDVIDKMAESLNQRLKAKGIRPLGYVRKSK